jgi:hypothetical protein
VDQVGDRQALPIARSGVDHIRDSAGITITRIGGKKAIVLHRRIENRRLVAVGPIWALAALRHSPAKADTTVPSFWYLRTITRIGKVRRSARVEQY